MRSFLLSFYPLHARWATSVTLLQQNWRWSDGMWAHSPHFFLSQKIVPSHLSFRLKRWGVFPFLCLTLDPLLCSCLGDPSQASRPFLVFSLSLPIVWFFSTFRSPQHSLQKVGKQKVTSLPTPLSKPPPATNPKSWAGLSAYTDLLLKLFSTLKDAPDVCFNIILPQVRVGGGGWEARVHSAFFGPVTSWAATDDL